MKKHSNKRLIISNLASIGRQSLNAPRLAYNILVVIFFLYGCNQYKFNDGDFVGIWRSADGAEIVINKDGSCILKGIDKDIISIRSNNSEKLNAHGTWKIIDNINSGITGGASVGIKITYNYNSMDRIGTGLIQFYISGQGINESNPPYDLFIWDGDPDDMIKYKFIKQ